MHTSLLLTAILPLLAAASPVTKRAGGPAAVPIPSTCTVIKPLPNADCGIGNVNGYKPSEAFNSAHSLYYAYFSGLMPVDEQWTQCSQQCYGFGPQGICKSAVLAYNAPTPEGYYGTEGGALETGCLLFDDYLTPNDFVAAPEGQYVNATAGSIYCDY